jgi:hypothetical protein
VSRGTWDTSSGVVSFRVRAFHPLWRNFPDPSTTKQNHISRSRNPGRQVGRFRLFPVRSPLLGESRLISTPRVTEMVHFTRCRLPCLWIQQGIPRHDPRGVAPFGYRRINACLPLPDAFRSLPRPSSPVGAKASTVRPYELDPKGVETSSQIARTGLFLRFWPCI